MSWSILQFGKYEGKSLPQVLFSDADWFFWAWEDNVLRGQLRVEAELLYTRATSIRVPQDGGERLVIEYMMYPGTGKCCGFDLVEESRPRHEGSTPTRRSGHIDLSFARQCADYDKLGCNLLVRSLKHAYFGDENFRMTRKRCEDFFGDAANFHRFR